MEADERELPQPVRAERLLGPKLEQEAFEVVETVDGGEGAGERAGRRAEDPADPRPVLGPADSLEESELHQDAVHAAAGEDDRHVAPVAVSSSL